jgi:hypothetical protein
MAVLGSRENSGLPDDHKRAGLTVLVDWALKDNELLPENPSVVNTSIHLSFSKTNVLTLPDLDRGREELLSHL